MLIVILAHLVSCEKGMVESIDEKVEEIDFSVHFTHDGELTKGSVIANAAGVANASGFDVWAYSHTGLWASALDKTIIINNTGLGYGHVTSSDAGLTWSYGTTQVWPLNKRVSFFAYAPHGKATLNGTVNDVPKIDYVVPSSVAAQPDLMIATPVYNRLGNIPVNEIFNHALSRIKFSASKSNATLGEVIITGIEIRNIYSKGSTTLEVPSPTSWTVDNMVTDSYVLSSAAGGLTGAPLTNNEQDIISSTGTMFLMPQTLNASAELYITFTVKGYNMNWTTPIPSPEVWLPGKTYNYQLLIDGDIVIVFCGEMESSEDIKWDDV